MKFFNVGLIFTPEVLILYKKSIGAEEGRGREFLYILPGFLRKK